ncbi:hypothetical protein AB6F95_004635 [Salmonella enterica]
MAFTYNVDEFIDCAVADMVKIKGKLEVAGIASPETVAAIYNAMVLHNVFSDEYVNNAGELLTQIASRPC